MARNKSNKRGKRAQKRAPKRIKKRARSERVHDSEIYSKLGETKKMVKARLERENKLDKKLSDLLIFFVKFNLFLIPLYLISYYHIDLSSFEYTIANAVSGLLRATGVNAFQFNNFISVAIPGGSFGGFIMWDCTGWKSTLVFLALVLSTPADWIKRLTSLAYIPIIILFNILRIWFVFSYVHVFGIANYELIHQTLWSYGMIAVVLALWVAWWKIDIS